MLGEIPNIGWPLDAENDTISAPFGVRRDPVAQENRMHYGITVSCGVGARVFSVSDGKCVVCRSQKNGFGKWVLIHSRFEDLAIKDWFFFFSHLSAFKVSYGDIVKKGDLIGYTGQSGRVLTPQFYFQVNKEDADKKRYGMNAVNPNLFYGSQNGGSEALSDFVRQGVFPERASDVPLDRPTFSELAEILRHFSKR
ncbi:MAG: murein DD-endopeptidase MepM/ murein hydrolase activator NlpD [Candidatus Marinamargulisbacteria bacterium]|jgi:murein DD-endopeptidase MepM/ murein hydrolase activator NlpD